MGAMVAIRKRTGFSRARVVETTKMAIALFENNVPFILAKKEEMLSMVKGTDYMGIVPEDVIPRYCHSMFPEQDSIIDFLNPWIDPEVSDVIIEKATFYPVWRYELCSEVC